MARWFLRVMYELGRGRAIDNACRERNETARILATIRALETRCGTAHGGPTVEAA